MWTRLPLSTVGKKIDILQNKTKINDYFKILESIHNDKLNEFRYRFMILDLIELRKNKWVSRKK